MHKLVVMKFLVTRAPPGTPSWTSAGTSSRATLFVSSWAPILLVLHKYLLTVNIPVSSWRCTSATTPTTTSTSTTAS